MGWMLFIMFSDACIVYWQSSQGIGPCKEKIGWGTAGKDTIFLSGWKHLH